MFLLFSHAFFFGGLIIRVVVTWTGGKDCCLACYEAISQGYEVSNLLNFEFTDVEKRTEYKFSNLLNYVFMNFGRSTPYKASILLNYMFRAVGKRAPRRVSNLLSFMLRAVGKHGPRKFSNLLTLMVKNDSKMIWHELSPEIVALQAQAMGIPIVQRETTWGTFEDRLKATIRTLDRKDAEGMVWGIRPPDSALLDDTQKLGDYIHLQVEKEWVYKVCGDLKVKPILPLWEKHPEQVLIDLIEKGFEVIIVVVNPDYLSEGWLGRKIDQTFLKEIHNLHREKGVPVGGDDYHTFVTDGPLFKKRLKVLQSRKLSKGSYFILDITKAELVEKTDAA
jgi:diphthine-ammonia ligase